MTIKISTIIKYCDIVTTECISRMCLTLLLIVTLVLLTKLRIKSWQMMVELPITIKRIKDADEDTNNPSVMLT
jgi:hypothetical protein